MQYKGINKFYIDIGIREDYSRHYYKIFIFRLFYLRSVHKEDQGAMLKFGENYIGINYESKGWKYKTNY